ncbi:MAG: ArsR family transcriptional regulator [Actinobacteria bacterium]|nr:MAG: ArsR family transcriptional regulator [Actinomycetota bacterium]
MADYRHFMQTRSPSILPILRSQALANLLAYVFVNEPMMSISQIANAIGVAPSTVKREVDELEQAGILTTVRAGRNRLVRADDASPFYPELRALILKAFGPVAIAADVFAKVPRVEAVYIFGSWARRYHGERGPLPRDLDILVVGEVDPDAVSRASGKIERVLGQETNATIVEPLEWEDASTPFLRTVRRGPLVAVREP